MMSSVSAGCLLALSGDVIPVVLASPFSGSPLVVSSSRPALRVGGRGADGAACLPRDVMIAAAWAVGVACFGCDAMAMVYLLCLCCVPLLPSPPYCFERMATETGTAPI